MSNFLSRKFILVLLTSIANFVLIWFSKIDASTYSLITLGVLGAYITGNVIERNKEA